ncbi:putative sensor histidine kinase [Solidesulfovibrio magneticus RS-1]|uniref:histidine kinase n=2 Tax=Solidesulfovibrio TaxID=2910984 RepID=C4XNN3_SOLM1|nr:putative sensor histidine kinase [Solidesulfovibrio magneticus RS-1]
MDNLTRRIFLPLLLTGIMVIVVYGIILTSYEQKRRADNLEQIRFQLLTLYELRREDIGNEIFGGKRLALADTLQKMRFVHDIVTVTAFNPEGKALEDTSGEAADLTRAELDQLDQVPQFVETDYRDLRVAVLTTMVEVIGERVGYVRIRFDLSKLQREAQSSYNFFLALLLTLFVIMSLTLHVIIKRMVIRPVTRLRDAMTRVRDGRLEISLDIETKDIIGELAASFNEMTAALKKAREDRSEAIVRLEDSLVALSRKAEELAEANHRLMELDKLKSDFISSVSHELRTPMTSVLGFAKLIHRDFAKLERSDRTGPKAHALARRIDGNIAIIIEEGDRLTSLINDVLDLAKIESGSIQWRDREVDVVKLGHRALRAVEGVLDKAPRTRLISSLPDHMPKTIIDPERLLQVLINLLSNAIKFTPQGTVELKARCTGNVLRLTVADQGIGIPPQELERIFDNFHQVRRDDSPEHKPHGVGLGLAICRRIVDHYHGRIWAESDGEHGSTFHVELAVADTTATDNVILRNK